MLLFSTILNIKSNMTQDDFINLVIEWNQSSPHEDNIIQNLVWNGERNIRYEYNNLVLSIEEYQNENIIAVRYEKRDQNGTIWNSDYIMNFNKYRMAIRLDRSFAEDAFKVNLKFSTPHFITLLINKGYLLDDEMLPILQKPIEINEDNIELLGNIISGEVQFCLPVVYISKTKNNRNPVNVELLARRLKGIAHVLVQSCNTTNYVLREQCNSQNEYNGAMGIYFTYKNFIHRRFLYRASEGYDDFLLEKVIRMVIQHGNLQTIDSLFTWQGVNNAILKDRLGAQREGRAIAEKLQKKAETELLKLVESVDSNRRQAFEDAQREVNNILDSFEEDLHRLEKKVEELSAANDALQFENQGLKNKLDNGDRQAVLFCGEEYEFYAGEIKDILLSVLNDSLDNLSDRPRRKDVVKDIINCNDYQRIGNQTAEKLKLLLRDYSGMNNRLRNSLKTLGYEISEDGKHFKITYYGDTRYQTVFGKTPSDGRSGMNNARTVIKMSL